MAGTTNFWTEERAQTAQDFAIGISIFLLVVGAVFAYFPTLFTPYGQAIQGEDTSAQAERVGMLIVDGEEDRNVLTDESWVDEEGGQLQQDFGLASTSQVEITLTELEPDGEERARGGHEHQEQDASSISRIVQVNHEEFGDVNEDDCDPACRLTVRVW
ncbi:DUF7287 family protein [Natranaeroarchaeum aerophilus]|uniref:Uncharacterized protein n=1 Tax=Natranaeroarchaeum aerophilus TaxID=2917711 RepID=A0AAE3FSK1_9EURY|nr:hypothetical protein [Natranaeroarchaeum aerophilus]MCL9814335.1 hypothetical protein [Natranaeroarchaeum aerophilus]